MSSIQRSNALPDPQRLGNWKKLKHGKHEPWEVRCCRCNALLGHLLPVGPIEEHQDYLRRVRGFAKSKGEWVRHSISELSGTLPPDLGSNVERGLRLTADLAGQGAIVGFDMLWRLDTGSTVTQYSGFFDSGYKITQGNRRTRSSGKQRDRRPWKAATEAHYSGSRGGISNDPPGHRGGQAPVPPCAIWCPNSACNALIHVGLPPGFDIAGRP